MFWAEIKGKTSLTSQRAQERSEDILTSNVFSFLKYSNRDKYLKNVLALIGVSDNANKVDLFFWLKYTERTEPDVVVITDNYYILFEAKYLSDLDLKQVKRETEIGVKVAKKMGKQFIYVAITNDYHFETNKFRIIKDYLNNAKVKNEWMNWSMIYDVVQKNKDDIFASDFQEYLEFKGLRRFIGLQKISVNTGGTMETITNNSIKKAYEILENVYKEISRLINEFDKFFDKNGYQMVVGKGKAITSNNTEKYDSPESWAKKKFSIFYTEKSNSKNKGNKTETLIGSTTKLIQLGFILNAQNLTNPVLKVRLLSKFNKKNIKWDNRLERWRKYFNTYEDRLFQNKKFYEVKSDANIEFEVKEFCEDLTNINDSNLQDIFKLLKTDFNL